MGENKYKNPLVTLEEINKSSRKLLYKVNDICTIEHISIWKSDAKILLYKYSMLHRELENEIEILNKIYKQEDTEFNSQNVFLRMVSSNPALKIQFKIDQMKQAVLQIHDLINKLDYWIQVTLENLIDERELSIDLQMYKTELLHQYELFSRDDFDLERFKSRINDYRSYGKYSQFERTFVNFVKQKNIKTVQVAMECIHKLIRIVDETIIWYENFIRRN